MSGFLKTWVPILTPQWLPAFNAHWLFGYGLVYTFPHVWVIVVAEVCFAVKEFYIDKHFEMTPQTFAMNLGDFGGYTLGVALAIAAHGFRV